MTILNKKNWLEKENEIKKYTKIVAMDEYEKILGLDIWPGL